MPRALFAGLTTFDLIHLVDAVPGADEKVTAAHQVVAAGGPAANAAVTFAHLGGTATLVTAVGAHPLAAGIRADLAERSVRLVDVAAADAAPPSVSSVLVTAGTGTRAVVSRNAAGRDAGPPADLDRLAAAAEVVLVDGHHPRLALAAARAGRRTVLDGGSWKPHLPDLLPHVDVAICSADLRPPGGGSVPQHLRDYGVGWVAVTDGPRPVRWAGPGVGGSVAVPRVAVVDTTGAGDVFHGAFVYALATAGVLDEASFVAALRSAGAVAARSCRSFGTREWLHTTT